jgi:ribose 5-phosphate isomerase B
MHKTVIAIASDHAGVDLKNVLKQTLGDYASEVIDLGTHNKDSVDYPDYGNALAKAIADGKAHYGVAICGSGIGISIAANRHKGIRAALCQDGLSAALSRRHNNANVLCLGARLIGEDTAKDCVKQFFTTDFEGGRHEKRLAKLDN